MKTNRPARRRFRPLILFTLLAISAGRAPAADQPELVTKLEALNKPENLVGDWKSIGARGRMEGATLTLHFSSKGEFEMTTERDGRKSLETGTYTVSAPRWPLEVTAVGAEKKHYLAITIMPNDQIVLDELKSFADADVTEAFKNSLTLARQSTKREGASTEKPAPDGLQKGANLVGTWKHPGLKVTMRFSETGDYELRNEMHDQPTVVKGSYTAKPSGDSMIVHVTLAGGQDDYAIRLLSRDQFAWRQLKSPDTAPDPEKDVVWSRIQ
jgi:uncharacterized protein (TIGR03066 family)